MADVVDNRPDHDTCGPDWEAIGAGLDAGLACAVWRNYCDGLNQRWLGPHLSAGPVGTALKTDAFDEAVGEGSYAALSGAAECVFVMDVSPSTCQRAARRTASLRAVAADVRRLPFRDGSLDTVVSLSTLDHFATLAEIGQALGELHRALRPGGRLLMTLDNLDNPLIRLRNTLPGRVLQKTRLVPYPVGVTLTARGLCRLLAETGFEIEERTTLMHIPRVAAVMLAALINRLRSRRARRWLCRALTFCEFLAALPTAPLTANYIAVAARKPGSTATAFSA